jgi:hypothetical protein
MPGEAADAVLAQFFLRGVGVHAVRSALDAVLGRDGYGAFDEARIPPGYPAQGGEFDRWLLAGPDDRGTVTLVADEVRRAFARARDLAAALPGARIVALVRPPAEGLRLKAWRDGALWLKVGDDPDEELFYNPLPADAAAVAAFLADWGGTAAGPDPRSVAAALGVLRVDRTFRAAREGAWPASTELLTFASRKSRLYLES